jgi:hypothetical protein
MNRFSTVVPQPPVTSGLAQNGGQGFDMGGGVTTPVGYGRDCRR